MSESLNIPPALDPNDHDLWLLLKKVESDGLKLIHEFWMDQDKRKKSLKTIRAIETLQKSTQELKDAYHNPGCAPRGREKVWKA